MTMRDPYSDDSPWLDGQATNQPAGPQAQATADPNPWTAPAASAAPAATQAPAATSGSYTQDLGQTGSQAPGTASASAAQTPDYDAHLQAVQTAPDPQSQAVAKDGLARTLQQDLEADGHTVTWKGDQMMVDGRAYELGSGPSTQPVGTPQRETGGPGGVVTNPQNADGRGVDPQQYYQDYLANFGLKARQSDPTSLQPLVDAMRTEGYNVTLAAPSSGGYVKGIMLNGQFVKLLDGHDRPIWQTTPDAPGGDAGAASMTPLQASPYAAGGGAIPEWLQHPTPDPGLMDLAGTIPGWEDIYKTLSATSPEEQATSDLVTQILQHPESLDQQTIDTMKAKNAEEAQAAAQAQDEELQHFGYASGAGNGLSDSPWLASQRADTAWNARNAVIGSNRNIDIEAARTNQGDRRAAAGIGQEWVAYRQGKSQSAIQIAVDSTGAKGNLEAAAKQLGMTTNQLLINYIGQNLNYDINLKTLQQRGEQFLLDLAQRISEQHQQSDQFQANFGLDLSKFQHTKDQDAWLRAQQTFA